MVVREWAHLRVCTEGLTRTEEDRLYDVILAFTKRCPMRMWGTEDGSVTSKCSCDYCYKKEQEEAK